MELKHLMSQAELLSLVISIFTELGIEHMLVGSHASSFWGEARSTHDVDLVVKLDEATIPQLVRKFDHKRYYLSEIAFREGRMANIIDMLSGDKLDCFMLDNNRYDQLAFSRRLSTKIIDVNVDVASAEDTILSKLRWSNMAGGSAQQLMDARHIMRVQTNALDVPYLEREAGELGVSDLLRELIDGQS